MSSEGVGSGSVGAGYGVAEGSVTASVTVVVVSSTVSVSFPAASFPPEYISSNLLQEQSIDNAKQAASAAEPILYLFLSIIAPLNERANT